MCFLQDRAGDGGGALQQWKLRRMETGKKIRWDTVE
jgi:hypothetical protein